MDEQILVGKNNGTENSNKALLQPDADEKSDKEDPNNCLQVKQKKGRGKGKLSKKIPAKGLFRCTNSLKVRLFLYDKVLAIVEH